MAISARAAFDSSEALDDYQTILPLWAIDYKNEATFCKWLSSAFDLLMDNQREAIQRARDNTARYKGMYPGTEPTIGGRDMPQRMRRQPRMSVPHFKDLVEQKVTKHTKSKPNTTVVPPNPEIEDKLDAHVAEEVLFSVKYQNDVDAMLTRAVRMAVLGGTAFVYTQWDSDKGDLHPDWKKKREKKEKVVLRDNEGNPVQDIKGKDVEITQPIYQGDISYRLKSIYDTFLDPQCEPEDCQWVMFLDYVPAEQLKKDYPNIASKVKASDKATYFNPNTLIEQSLENHVAVFTFYHRSNKYLEDGLYVKCTAEFWLETPRANPISYIPNSDFGNLPIRILRDITVEGELYGYPSASDIAPLQSIYDKIITLCVKNIFWASHFRVFATQGSVDRAEMTNDSTIVWVKPGYTEPKAIAFQAFGADVFNFAQYLETSMEKVFGIFSISRGAPPPGTRAAASLYFYDEQESQRGAVLQKQINKLIVDLDKLTLAIIADNYKDHDNRLIKVLGSTKSWIVKRFKVDSLRKAHDIRIENSPNLPDSRYAKFELLTSLKERIPGAVSDEQFADLLDFGNHDKFITPTRQARLGAEAENEDFMRGGDVQDPMPYEDLIVHWQTHIKELQNPGFKDWPEKRQNALLDHVMATEMLMDEFAEKSAAFSQQLALLPQFPTLFERTPALPPTPEQMMQEEMPVEEAPPPSEPVAPQLSGQSIPEEFLPQQPVT